MGPKRTKSRAKLGLLVTSVAVATSLLAGCASDEPGKAELSFTFALSAAPKSLDITKNFNAIDIGVMSLFTEPLERVGTDGSLSPNLATKVSQPDDTTIVYSLREDVQFSNGEPLTAADVAWSIEHAADDDAGAQTSSILASIASVEETEPMEVTVKLTNPDPTVRQTLGLTALVQNAKFAKENGENLGTPEAVPIGTGPYQVTDYKSDSIALKRNANYWATDPAPEKIHINAISTANTGQLAMRSGEIQGTVVNDTSTMPQWETIKGSTVYDAPQMLANYLSLDTTTAPFDDVHVRKAIAYAIDRDGVLQAASGDYGSVLDSLFPPEMLTPVAPSETAVSDFLRNLPTYDFDLEAAKNELTKSEHPNGFSETVPYVSEMPWSKLAVLNLQENLRPLGVTIKPEAISRQQWVDSVFSHDTTSIWPMSLAGATADPKDLNRIVTERAITETGGYNFAKWSPADLAKPAATLATTLDKANRWKATQTILEKVATEVPYIPLFQPQFVVVLGDGFSFTEPQGLLEMSNGSWISKLELE